MCLSGGGYRAALFHLGALSLLNEVKVGEGVSLLDHVHTITSISGGALTAIEYVLSEIDGNSRKDTFRRLYHDIVYTNIGEMLLKRFDKESKLGRSLIQTLADIYDETFFHERKFGSILEGMSWQGVHHFYVDATDFDIGKPFRFQATAQLNIPNRETDRGLIGNWQHKIGYEEAKRIRLADIMAATSCFPIVFEPFEYPTEFKFEEGDRPHDYNMLTIPLMDGGIIDNQGIEPALHAHSHLQDEGKDIDLILICDAGNISSGQLEKDFNSMPISPKCLCKIIAIVGIASFIGMFCAKECGSNFISGILGATAFFSLLLCMTMLYADKVINEKIAKIAKLKVGKSALWNRPVRSIGTFLKSRFLTAYRMNDVVMSGNQKRLWYRLIKKVPELFNKFQMNSLSLFSPAKKWKNIVTRQGLDATYRPTSRMKNIAQKATEVSTSLWFTKQQLSEGTPKMIFACGRFTTCWNLLIYIDRLKKLKQEDRTEFQNWFIAQEQPLLELWDKFKQNPEYNIKRYTD